MGWIRSRLPSDPPSATYPLAADAGGTYFETPLASAHLPIGYAAWLAPAQLSLADQTDFLDGLAARGFNSCYVQLFAKRCDHTDDASEAGNAPFTNLATLTVNPDYLDDLAAFFQIALDLGIQCQVSFYYGYNAEPGDGYYNEFVTGGASACRTMAATVAARFASLPNVNYQVGADMMPGETAISFAIFDGIRDSTGTALITSYWGSAGAGTTSRDFAGRDWHFPCGVSSWGDPAVLVTDVYGLGSPVSYQEGKYEHNDLYGWSRLMLRTNTFNSFLNGAKGGLYYGNERTWYFGSTDFLPQSGIPSGHTWQEYLTDPGCLEHAAIGAFIRSFANWHELEPDVSSALVTAGRGSGASFVGAAKTPDGSLAMAFAPTATTFTVDRSEMSGPFTARWWNPVSFSYTPIASGITNTGTQNFNSPGNADSTDSVLVLTVD